MTYETTNTARHSFSPHAMDAAIVDLKAQFADRLSINDQLCAQHANTLTWIAAQAPNAVVFAETTQEVSDVVRVASRYRVPIVAFGAGTSLEGQTNAPFGGISLDLSAMDRIIEVNATDLDCVVEAGVTRARLNSYLRDTGLFFAVDPGAEEATLGGMAATRASGTCAVRYGTMSDNVLNVTAVMADGSVIKTGGRARKSAAGYDLTHLLVGSEGTLGIITELTLRLHGTPEAVMSAVAPFETLRGACNATSLAMQLGLGLARIELLDPVQISAVNKYSKTSFTEAPTLFLEFHGSPGAVREQVGIFEEIAKAEGAVEFQWAELEEERKRLWKARHDAFWAITSTWPGRKTLVTDVCVPISRLAECIAETEEDVARSGLIAPIVGHVGDGNFHAIVLFDPDDEAERGQAAELAHRLAERAITMEGTCTGEHGIGQGKIGLLEREAGAAVPVMKAVKAALDPDNILNPGKIFGP